MIIVRTHASTMRVTKNYIYFRHFAQSFVTLWEVKSDYQSLWTISFLINEYSSLRESEETVYE